MIYTQEEVNRLKIRLLSVQEFIAEYHPKLTEPAIRYAMNKNNIDSVVVGKLRMVALTLHTLNYVPAKHPKRPE